MDQLDEFVTECIELMKEIEAQAAKGNTQVVLRNPTTGEKVILDMPIPKKGNRPSGE